MTDLELYIQQLLYILYDSDVSLLFCDRYIGSVYLFLGFQYQRKLIEPALLSPRERFLRVTRISDPYSLTRPRHAGNEKQGNKEFL